MTVITRTVEVSPSQLADLNQNSSRGSNSYLQIGVRLNEEDHIKSVLGATDDLIASEMSKRNLIRVSDFETQKLIDELKDRGFVVMDKDEAEEVAGDLAAGETVLDLITGLRGAFASENYILQNQLITALIFLATGEEVELVFEDEQDAA